MSLLGGFIVSRSDWKLEGLGSFCVALEVERRSTVILTSSICGVGDRIAAAVPSPCEVLATLTVAGSFAVFIGTVLALSGTHGVGVQGIVWLHIDLRGRENSSSYTRSVVQVPP